LPLRKSAAAACVRYRRRSPRPSCLLSRRIRWRIRGVIGTSIAVSGAAVPSIRRSLARGGCNGTFLKTVVKMIVEAIVVRLHFESIAPVAEGTPT
jgi:hypothetical protein